jgi:hypothetical protein
MGWIIWGRNANSKKSMGLIFATTTRICSTIHRKCSQTKRIVEWATTIGIVGNIIRVYDATRQEKSIEKLPKKSEKNSQCVSNVGYTLKK